MMMENEDLQKLLEIQEKIIKSNKMQNANVNELLEIQKETLKLIEETQESLRRSINKQDNQMDSLRDMMNFQFKILIFYILILHIMSYMI